MDVWILVAVRLFKNNSIVLDLDLMYFYNFPTENQTCTVNDESLKYMYIVPSR